MMSHPNIARGSKLRKLSRGIKGNLKSEIRAATADGWMVCVSGSNHIRLDHPLASRPVYAPLTAGGHFAHKRLRGDMSRALRQEAA